MDIKKEIGIGLFVGFVANTIGALLYMFVFSDLSIESTIKAAHESRHLGSIVALGAILNLAAFFGFLKIHRDHRAKGVLIATVIAAIAILIYKILY